MLPSLTKGESGGLPFSLVGLLSINSIRLHVLNVLSETIGSSVLLM